MDQIGYGTHPDDKYRLPVQMGAIDELSSHESEVDILPSSCAPQGFLNF